MAPHHLPRRPPHRPAPIACPPARQPASPPCAAIAVPAATEHPASSPAQQHTTSQTGHASPACASPYAPTPTQPASSPSAPAQALTARPPATCLTCPGRRPDSPSAPGTYCLPRLNHARLIGPRPPSAPPASLPASPPGLTSAPAHSPARASPPRSSARPSPACAARQQITSQIKLITNNNSRRQQVQIKVRSTRLPAFALRRHQTAWPFDGYARRLPAPAIAALHRPDYHLPYRPPIPSPTPINLPRPACPAQHSSSSTSLCAGNGTITCTPADFPDRSTKRSLVQLASACSYLTIAARNSTGTN